MDNKFETTKKYWRDEVLSANLKWPDEFVIRFMKRNYRNAKYTTVLDFGCGAGRNSIALAEEGYNVIAMDYNSEIIADGSLLVHNITNATLMLKNMKCVLKKNGKIWANWRTKNDWLYKKGDYLGDGLYDMYKSTGREHSTNLFCDKSMICSMYENAGYEIESIEEYSFTEDNGTKRSDYYQVIGINSIDE